MSGSLSAMRLRPRRLLGTGVTSPLQSRIVTASTISRPAASILLSLSHSNSSTHTLSTYTTTRHTFSGDSSLSETNIWIRDRYFPHMLRQQRDLPQYSFGFQNLPRRWASSLIEEDDESDFEEDYFDESDDEILEEDALEIINNDEPLSPGKQPKRSKLSKRQKRKLSLAGNIQLLHFKDAIGDDSIETQRLKDEFDKLAMDHDLSTFKWISQLERSLLNKLRREEEKEEGESSKSSRKAKGKPNDTKAYWRMALKAANKQEKVPDKLKDHFLSSLIVGPEKNSPSEQQQQQVTTQAQQDAMLLARARDLAVENPLLWRRYNAKERKIRVRGSKQLIEKRLSKIDTNSTSDSDDMSVQAIMEAMDDRSTSLDYYLSHVRIPTLRQIHHQTKTADQRNLEAVELQALLQQRLPETAYEKILDLVHTYVVCFSESENDEESDDDDKTLVFLQQSPLVTIPMTKKERQKQQKQFRVLLSNLRKVVPQGRIHTIAEDIANFFYVTAPDDVDRKNEGCEVASDKILVHSAAHWNEIQDQYIHSLRSVQTIFLELERKENQKQKAHKTIDKVLDPLEDPSSEQSVIKTFDTVTALARMDAKKISTQRVRPRTYIPLEAMAMGDSWKTQSAVNAFFENQANNSSLETDNPDPKGAHPSVLSNEGFPPNPSSDRLVIIDNLPIDVTESRLRQAYGRCGDIEAVAIFHARPDLDPGKRAADAKKKIRNPSSSSHKQKWSRPRTPLYAMMLFKDSGGAQKASCNPLRLFGMVLDYHAMRSYRASDMTTLYLEDVRSSVDSMESEINQLLEPSDLYVSLDSTSSKHWHRFYNNKKSKHHPPLSSYAIRFPSFASAYWAYWNLSKDLEVLQQKTNPTPTEGGPALHWMETPPDSHLYWTRKLNF